MSHDPVFSAAVVTVAGTIVGTTAVAITSFFTTAWSTRRTLASGERSSKTALEASERSTQQALEANAASAREAARAERAHKLWEKRTEVYRHLAIFMSQVQAERISDMNKHASPVGRNSELNLSWQELNPDLVVYGSDAVHQAAIKFVTFHIQLINATEAAVNRAGKSSTELEEAYNHGRGKAVSEGVELSRQVTALVRAESQSLD